MKPARFDFARARSVKDAVDLLREGAGSAKLVAGAQSLGPMLNLRLVEPRLLIDITGIPELTRVDEDADSVTLGACVTSANIEDARVPLRGLAMLPAVATRIAYRAVRNRGTIGGSLCHADPAADWIAVLCALGAQCVITGPAGVRRLPIEAFVVAAFETALGPCELLEAVRIPRVGRDGVWGYVKLCPKSGEFATAIGAVVDDRERRILRAVVGAIAGKPLVIDDGPALRGGGSGDRRGVDERVLRRLLEARGVVDSVACRHHAVVLRRAFAQAIAA